MPKQPLTVDTVRTLRKAPPSGETDYWDTKQPGLVLRARPTGRHSYRVWLGRGRWFTLGAVSAFKTPDLARTEAQKRLGQVASGADPQAEKRRQRSHTVNTYLAKVYAPWLSSHWRRGADTAARLEASFGAAFGHLRLDALSSWHVEQWRHARLKAGRRPATVNREIGVLKAMLNRAVEWGHVAAHPFAKVKPLREDKTGRLRYLTSAEDTRLRAALTARDDRRRAERERANDWRRERGYDEWPAFGPYTDHMTPIVLFALHTGLRFGELTGLDWRDVDVTRALVTVRTDTAKSGRARHVPLNTEAVRVLKAWRPEDVAAGAYVFPGRDGERLQDVKTAWAKLLKAAALEHFRFHDLRHTFASKLAMAGVDLNTVRELLGHAGITMTLRYAHLVPEHKAAAVAKLV